MDIQFAWGRVSAGEKGTEGMSMSQLFDVADSRMYADKRQAGSERLDDDKMERKKAARPGVPPLFNRLESLPVSFGPQAMGVRIPLCV